MTFSQGADAGHFGLQGSVYDINGKWPGIPVGGGKTKSVQADIRMVGDDANNAIPLVNVGSNELGGNVWTGKAHISINDGMGGKMLDDVDADITIQTASNGGPDASFRPELIARIFAAGAVEGGTYNLQSINHFLGKPQPEPSIPADIFPGSMWHSLLQIVVVRMENPS